MTPLFDQPVLRKQKKYLNLKLFPGRLFPPRRWRPRLRPEPPSAGAQGGAAPGVRLQGDVKEISTKKCAFHSFYQVQ